MERVKEALERAARERVGAAHAPVPTSARPGRPSAGGRPTATSTGYDPATAAGPPVYTTTRVLQRNDAALRAHRVLMGDTDDPSTRAIKRLRTLVLQQFRARNLTTLALTSPRSGAGTTYTAVNLAVSLARELEHTVCLVDLNWQRPGVAACFGADATSASDDRAEPQQSAPMQHTLVDVLDGRCSIPQALFNPGIARLVVLPGGIAGTRAAELLASGAVAALVQELRRRYPDRFLIFDLPPLLSHDDAMAFLPNVDATLLVVRAGHTARDDIRTAIGMLDQQSLLGVVLNDDQARADPTETKHAPAKWTARHRRGG